MPLPLPRSAAQAAVVEIAAPAHGVTPTVPNLRALLLGGDFFLGGVIAGTFSKLVLRLQQLGVPAGSLNKHMAEAMLYIVSILRLGESPSLPCPLDNDSRDRMLLCLKVLSHPDAELAEVSAAVRFLANLHPRFALGRESAVGWGV